MLIPNQRHLFDIPEELAYLNCAYISPSLKSVTKAGWRGITRKRRPWTIKANDFFDESEEARSLFAQIIGASPNDIAIIPAASYGIAIASLNLPVGKNQSVVVLEEQFPSNYYGWLGKIQKSGGNLVIVERSPSTSITSKLIENIHEKTALVAIPNCHWTDGALVDLMAVSKRCKDAGCALVLDLAQSAGVLPFSVLEIDPDFIVAPSYKWLLGPYSLGFLYVAPRWQDGTPLEHNWIDRANSEDFTGLVNYREQFQPGARKFDVGERSNFALMPMVVTALNQLLDWGVNNVNETLSKLTCQIGERAEAIGLNVAPPNKRSSHLMGIRFPEGVPKTLLESLAKWNVHVSVRGNSIRISPYLYNNNDDIDRLFEAFTTCQ